MSSSIKRPVDDSGDTSYDRFAESNSAATQTSFSQNSWNKIVGNDFFWKLSKLASCATYETTEL